MSDTTNDRKADHLRIITSDPATDRRKYHFDTMRLKHRALPELNLEDVDTSTVFMGRTLSFPLLISSMTGGSDEALHKINRNLAQAAEETQVAMGVGSQRVMFTHPEARGSFEIRRHAPSTLLFANLGAAQLNNGFSVHECREAVAAVQADALYLHLNPLQEVVQPEGNTNFAGLADKIGSVVKELEQPVVLKEVGAGLSREDVELVLPLGIRYVDVAGSGGTSWSRIEHHRTAPADSDDLGLTFQDWGIPTPLALLQLQPLADRVTVLASGGLRSGLDMAKAMVLGASLCGLAAPFLKPAMDSAAAVVRTVLRLKREFTTAMFLMGVGSVEDLRGNDRLLLQPTLSWQPAPRS